jgi:hypothetical protein
LRTTSPLLALLLAGCGAIVRPSELRPALHPLLEGTSSARPSGLQVAEDDPAAGTDADADLAGQRRALVDRALQALDGDHEVHGDAALVRAAFADARLDCAPEAFTSVDALRARSRPRRGRPRPADLVFFAGADFGPRVGVVTRVLRGGVVEAAFIARGAVRRIRFDVRRADQRRVDGGIVNTFVRPKRKDDPPGTAYLAGQLVDSVRTLLD